MKQLILFQARHNLIVSGNVNNANSVVAMKKTIFNIICEKKRLRAKKANTAKTEITREKHNKRAESSQKRQMIIHAAQQANTHSHTSTHSHTHRKRHTLNRTDQTEWDYAIKL